MLRLAHALSIRPYSSLSHNAVTTTLQLVPSPGRTTTKPKIRKDRAYAPSGDVGRRLAQAQALQLKIQSLTAELDDHRFWFLTHLMRTNLDTLELGNFTVTRKTRHNWSYTPETEREMLALRTTQKWEQTQGLATDAPTTYVALSTKAPKS